VHLEVVEPTTLPSETRRTAPAVSATGLMHEERIRTSPRSGAILSVSHMSGFVIGPESMIVLP
jgi:hypothetical protein